MKKRKGDPVDLQELVEYYVGERQAGNPPRIATVVKHAQDEGIRADCAVVLLFCALVPSLVFPPHVSKNDVELFECVSLAAEVLNDVTPGGFQTKIEVY